MVVSALLLAAAAPVMARPWRTRASAPPPPRPPGRAALALLAPRRARFATLPHPRLRPPIPAQSPAVAPATTAATSAGCRVHLALGQIALQYRGLPHGARQLHTAKPPTPGFPGSAAFCQASSQVGRSANVSLRLACPLLHKRPCGGGAHACNSVLSISTSLASVKRAARWHASFQIQY